MPLTLVSHYGEKPPALADLITDLHRALTQELGGAFVPYDVRQVHATLVGLEGTRIGKHIRNDNFLRMRNEERVIDFSRMLAWLRDPAFPAFQAQVGGFRPGVDYPFTSHGHHPSFRSFSIQGDRAVAMGWPRAGDGFPPVLAELRLEFERFGILHKWHPRAGVLDNDLFFVLGHCRAAEPNAIRRAEETVREQLAARAQLVGIDADCLSFVAYSDPALPLDGARGFRLNDDRVTAKFLERLYD